MPSRKADPFHWDGLVRLTHWGVAAVCIGNLWLNEAGEEWHEWLGYGAMALIGLRLLWGLTLARGHARLGALIPSRDDFRQQAVALRERAPAAPGHHGQRQAGGLGTLAAGAGDRRQRLVPEHRDRLRAGGRRLASLVYLGTAGLDSPAPVRHRLHLLASAQQPGHPHAAPAPAPGARASAGTPFLKQTGTSVPIFLSLLVQAQGHLFQAAAPALPPQRRDASPSFARPP